MNQNQNMQQQDVNQNNMNQGMQNQVQMNPNMYNPNIDATRPNNMQNNFAMNQNPYINQQANPMNIDPSMMNNQVNQTQSIFTNGDFVKGALIGAAVTYLLTNKNAQQTIMKAASKGTEMFQAGMEEIKERFEDAKAQMEANK